MDLGNGRFEQLPDNSMETIAEFREKHPKSKGVFTVGEELEIRGSRFRVKDISPWGIKLKLLPALDVPIEDVAAPPEY